MKPAIKLHHPHLTTHLPAHEQAARQRRAATERPAAPTSSTRRRNPTPLGRKTVDTRFGARVH
jgi:hypothetical protein